MTTQFLAANSIRQLRTVATASLTLTAEAARPNSVILYTGDERSGGLSVQSPQLKISTPNQ